jgi:hypothetical protein
VPQASQVRRSGSDDLARRDDTAARRRWSPRFLIALVAAAAGGFAIVFRATIAAAIVLAHAGERACAST